MSEKASTFRGKQEWDLPNLSSPFRTQYGELEFGTPCPKNLGMGNIDGVSLMGMGIGIGNTIGGVALIK